MSSNSSELPMAQVEDGPREQEDDDDLSITSTSPEDDDSEKEWCVDDVLAERPHPHVPGTMQYLIKWEGFELKDCTWEPLENLGVGLLPQWEETKREIDSGTRQPFDVATYDAACAARAERHARRNAKRQRLGLSPTPPFPPGYTDDTPVASPTNQDASESDDEAQEINTVDPASIPSSKPTASITAPASTLAPSMAKAQGPAPAPAPASSLAVVKQTPLIGIPSQLSQKGPTASRAPEGKSIAVDPTARAATSGASSKITRPDRIGNGGTMTGYQGTARRSGVFRRPAPKPSAQGISTTTTRPLSTAAGPSAQNSAPANNLAGKGLTATRTRQQPGAKRYTALTNVFSGGKLRKQRANLADVMADPSKEPKPFSNMRLMNIAKKRGIEKGDKAPASSWIPSKFILGGEETNRGKKKPSPISPGTIDSPQANQEMFDDSSLTSLATTSQQHAPTKSGGQDIAEEALPLKRKKSVRFTEEEQIGEAVGEIDRLFGGPAEANNGAAGPDASKALLATSKKLPLATYQERGQTQTIEKLAKFGLSKAVRVRFSGIARHTAYWLSAFKAHEILEFASTCTSYHFLSQKMALVGERLSTGAIEPASQEQALALRNVAESLRRGSIGLHLVTPEYSILVYPADCGSWSELDSELDKLDPNAPLRYLMYRSLFEDLRAYPSECLADANAEALDQLYLQGEANCPKLLKGLMGLDFDKMLPQDVKLKNKQVYMLLIPLKAKQLLMVIKAWLRSCQPTSRIFSVDQPESWRLFNEAAKAGNGGTIISHTDFTLWKLEKIRGVWRMLQGQRYTFWDLNTGEYGSPLYPSNSSATVDPGTLRLTRLFPFGKAFLITPSFVLSDPAKLCVFLKWFKKYTRNPHYLIVACFNFPQYLKDVTLEKEKEHKLLCRLNENHPDLNNLLERSGRRQRDLDNTFQAWELLREIMEAYGDEETSEDIRKVVWASEYIDPNDEQSLVNHFFWWSSMKMDQFRRFYVLGSHPNRIERAYRYIQIPRYSNTQGSDPDMAGVHVLRLSKAVEASKEAEESGTDINIAWGTGVVVENGQPRILGEPRKSISEARFSFPGSLFRTDNARELKLWIDNHRDRTARNWSELHSKPVSWKDWHMGDQFGDGKEQSSYDTFSGWLNAAPQFTPYRNTWYGLFYTITEEWNEYLPKRNYSRHPWIAICRPKNPHRIANFGFSMVDLFIWDQEASEREQYGGCFLDMQCQLVDYIYDEIGRKYPGCSLTNVWYSSAYGLPFSPDDNPLDIACRRIQEMFDNSRDIMPSREDLLPRAGWKAVDPRLWKNGMSPLTRKTKPWELNLKRIPTNEGDTEKPERLIWHPVSRETRRHGTKCLNELHEACLQARLQNPDCDTLRYQYRPTQEWYADQVEERGDYGYVCVDAADKILQRLEILG
ncbi:hypothetical protein F5Y19DRAFT_309244 [Xylariaceae sp. FL1651]|nr:hypothetical protein F5Y19DRAFT_309244 [Xylariaceae sp. FL1651]